MLYVTLPPLTAAVEVADIGLADNGDHGLLIDCGILGGGRSSGSNGQENGDQKLLR